jgi:hypothetical protein
MHNVTWWYQMYMFSCQAYCSLILLFVDIYIYPVFPGGKVRPGRDADPSPSSSAKVKNRVELYLYFPKGLRGL